MKMNNNGITLIALVITIIVMLILVVVTITMAVNGKLFDYVGKASYDTELAKQEEEKLGEGQIEVGGKKYDSTDDYIEGIESGSEKFSAIYKETISYKTKNDIYTAVIPKGFAVGISEGINKVDDGLVIQDEKGNQFVWVPVEFTETGNIDSHGLDSGFLEVFYRSAWSDNARTTGLSASYTEPYANGYSGENTDYYNMMRSVQNNKGFYIGRYEAGTTVNRKENDTPTPGTTTLVIKRDAYPYNMVCWGTDINNYTTPRTYTNGSKSYDYGYGAVFLSKNMYNDSTKYGVISTLCYGVQWDAILDFIIKNDNRLHDVNGSVSWGNVNNNTGTTWTITRQTAMFYQSGKWHSISDEESKKKEKKGSESILLTTGANDYFKAKNIFDILGNVAEWTMEAAASTGRTVRGGRYDGQEKASVRSYYKVTNVNSMYGFRVALYIFDD